MKLFVTTILFFFLGASSLKAQWVTQGPAIGAVTDTSARMYLRIPEPMDLEIRISTFPELSNKVVLEAPDKRNPDNSVIINIPNLQPDTRYYYHIYVDGQKDTVDGHFQTYPTPGSRGTFTFVTGSCQETPNMKVFDVIPKHKPYFLLHTGDYTYPDYQIAHDYSGNYELMALSYQKRYDDKVMKGMLRYIPIDYIYDDNDFVGMGGGRYFKNGEHLNSKVFWGHNEFITIPYPPHWRRNCIRGYCDFFPGYEMVDTTEGIYHSFVFGNAEFFFLDRCSAKPHSNSYAFEYNKKKDRYRFNPPDDHVLFGEKQMDWLKESLKNSTADWKFIVSGVPLNKSLRKLIDAGITIQKTGWENNNGMRMASGFANYWAGHPKEQYDFLNWLRKESIQDVIVISGDTHHNVMDDGRNAGLPEMNASGLSVTETYLAYYLGIIGKVTGRFHIKREVWNQGGNGIGNKNFKNAFGKITIVDNHHVEMSLIDEDNEVISSFNVYHSSQNLNRKGKPKKRK